MMSHVTLEHILRSHQERQRAVKAEEQAEEARNRQYWKEMEKDISPLPCKLHDILSDSCNKTGLWLEKKNQFRSWKNGETKSRCLWLSGIPGAGISSLVVISLSLISLTSFRQNVSIRELHSPATERRTSCALSFLLSQQPSSNPYTNSALSAHPIPKGRFNPPTRSFQVVLIE